MTVFQNIQGASDALQDTITLEWHVEDVQAVRPDLTTAQCRAVLQRIERDYDAAIGVNWSVLEEAAAMLFDPVRHTGGQDHG